MGLFGKKKDPLDDRKNSLNTEISSLEDQIEQLKVILEHAGDVTRSPMAGIAPETKKSSEPEEEPVFEPVDQVRLQDTKASNPFTPGRDNRSIHKEGSVSFWEKMTRFFRGPKSSNPKLVNYLAAGNIHGLRPLRYEKRIHRNRTLLWVTIILVALIGLIKMLIR